MKPCAPTLFLSPPVSRSQRYIARRRRLTYLFADSCKRQGLRQHRRRRMTTTRPRGEADDVTIRALSDREQEELEGLDEWCTYLALNGCPPENINMGDTICIQPCPPCPDITLLRIVDHNGSPICSLGVRWAAAGHCVQCDPNGKKYSWA